MLQRVDDLILKLGPIDGCATTTGARRIAALDHKALNDAVENDVVVLASLGQGSEVLTCLPCSFESSVTRKLRTPGLTFWV